MSERTVYIFLALAIAIVLTLATFRNKQHPARLACVPGDPNCVERNGHLYISVPLDPPTRKKVI